MSAYVPSYSVPLPSSSTNGGSGTTGSKALEPLIVAGELIFVLPSDVEAGEVVMQLVDV